MMKKQENADAFTKKRPKLISRLIKRYLDQFDLSSSEKRWMIKADLIIIGIGCLTLLTMFIIAIYDFMVHGVPLNMEMLGAVTVVILGTIIQLMAELDNKRN